VSFENLSSETVGEIEVERKVLVIKRIKQTFHLETDEGDRETVERVLEVYADGCPVARSVRNSIEITSELDFT
jgi:organic hydroperoxide reductase OsmC/OhrA